MFYFTKSEQHAGNNTGKPAYFAKMSHLSIRKKEEACASFQAKGYSEAATMIAQNFK